MRKFITTVGFALALAVGGLSTQALAEAKQDFKLVNKTGYQIKEVYVSPNASGDWEEDVLGQGLLDTNANVEIKFHRAATGCSWDLKVVYTIDNSSAVWRDIDLCTVEKITIKYNRDTDTTSASYE